MKNSIKMQPIPKELNLALQIDKLPIATPDMTEDELRDVVVKFMYLQHHFAFTPDLGGIGKYGYQIKNLSGYYKASESLNNIKIMFEEGKYYGGIPYMGNSGGSLYRWLDFYDAETGVMDWAPILRTRRFNWVDTNTGKIYPDVGSSYFGNTCASSCVWSWLRVTNKIDSFWTYTSIPKYGFVKVGDYDLNENDEFGSSTKDLCKQNGKDRMLAAYAKIKKADGMIKAGHAVMCVSDAVVTYDENGNIDAEASYVQIAEQKASFLTAPPAEGGVGLYSPMGDDGRTYRIMGNFAGNTVNGRVKDMKWSFEYLFTAGYMPVTVPELCGLAPVDRSEAHLYLEDEVYAEDKVNAKKLEKMRVKSNYAISDLHFIIRDKDENEVFCVMYAALSEDIVRTASVKVLKDYSVSDALYENVIHENKECISLNIEKYTKTGGHTLEITARVSTGEIISVYKGMLAE